MEEERKNSNPIQLLMLNLRRVFFILSFLVGIFFLTGKSLLGQENFLIIGNLLMPGYLLFVGILIGDLIASFMVIQDLNAQKGTQKIYIKFYIIGIIIGIILSALFMLY